MAALSFIIGVFVALMAVWFVRRRIGFLGQRPAHYAEGGPTFDLTRHLSGEMFCDGVIYGPSGRVVSRFAADFNIVWTGAKAIMSEHFRYDSGETQDRAWHLELGEDGRFTANADDLIGEGSGVQSGPTVCLSYRIKLPPDAGGHVLDVVDWMYLTPDGTIINRSQFRKYGFKVAELVATMRRKEPA